MERVLQIAANCWNPAFYAACHIPWRNLEKPGMYLKKTHAPQGKGRVTPFSKNGDVYTKLCNLTRVTKKKIRGGATLRRWLHATKRGHVSTKKNPRRRDPSEMAACNKKGARVYQKKIQRVMAFRNMLQEARVSPPFL
jgi:hypothetical protein